MSEHAPVRLLVNPAAGRGRALRRLDAARHALERVGPFDVVQTRVSGDEARLAYEAVRDGVQTLVVLGGDGTVSRVAGALLHSNTSLAILGAGTGNDLAKSLGAPVFDFDAVAERIRRNASRSIDVGDVDGRTFVNAVGVGFDVAVLERTTHARWLRGNTLYAVTALGALFQYRGFNARIEAGPGEGSDSRFGSGSDSGSAAASHPRATANARWLTIVVANGQWFGGAFRIAPAALLDDGKLDLVAISDASPFRRLRLFGSAPWGRHTRAPEVQMSQCSTMSLHFATPPLFQADGELYHATKPSLHIRVIPQSLSVIC